MPEDEKPKLQFIIDEPAKTDFFDTHTPVAIAIAESIQKNPHLKIIGLLGRWGSGKSTIIRAISEHLQRDHEKYLVFSYDAWLHQHDPLRRSFLESLVNFLIEKGRINRKPWKKRLKKLSGSLEISKRRVTPIVTSEAKLFFVLTGLFAIGLSFLGKDTFKDALGLTTTKAGIWTLRIGMFLCFGSISFWVARVYFRILLGKKAALFPAQIFNKNLTEFHSQTYKPIEPTSIEFGKAFRKLMREFASQGAHLVIVIDNIDRIDEKEAMQIWANVRSFFLSSRDDNSIEFEKYHPTLILPVDSQSITQMFSMGIKKRDGGRLAHSFINKTFDVTFEVPSPVMSDWKRYFADRMAHCLGNLFNEERCFRTRRFLESWFQITGTPVTPREINKSLNRVIALLMQWSESTISFESIAYYAINRDRLSNGISEEIARRNHPLARFSPDWARELAALHFGVSVDLAAQVLMTAPINKSILNDEPKILEVYRGVTGFGDILERVTENLPEDEGRPSPNFEIITNAAKLLATVEAAEVWNSTAWKNLVSEFNRLDKASSPYNIFERTAPFFEKVEQDDALPFLETIERIIDPLISEDDIDDQGIIDLGILASRTVEFAGRLKIRQPTFDVSGTAPKYLHILAALKDAPAAQRRVRTSAPRSELVAELSNNVTDPVMSLHVPSYLALLTSPSATLMLRGAISDLDPLITAIENVLRTHSGDVEIFRAALKTLASINGFEEQRRLILGRMADEGIFTSQLSAVASTDDAEAISILLTALVWKQVNISSPIGYFWSDWLKKFPLAPSQMNKLLDELFSKERPVEILFNFYNSNYANRDLSTYVMDDRIRRGNLGTINSANILRDIRNYSRVMNRTLREDFVRLLTGYDRFWPNIQNLPWNPNILETATLLSKRDGAEAERIKSELVERVRNTSEIEWTASIAAGDEPFCVATKFLAGVDLKLGVSSHLAMGLISNAKNAAVERHARGRWFDLAEILSGPGRRKVMEAMGAIAMDLQPVDKLKVLKAGGIRLFSEGGFVKQPDATIERIVLPLSRSGKGRSWLSDRSAQMRAAIEGSSPQNKEKLRKLMQDCSKSTNEDQRHWAEVIQKSWGIK